MGPTRHRDRGPRHRVVRSEPTGSFRPRGLRLHNLQLHSLARRRPSGPTDGTSRRVEKTHELRSNDIAWLVESHPETLILTEGWRGAVRVPEELRHLQGMDVRVLRTPDALRLFPSFARLELG